MKKLIMAYFLALTSTFLYGAIPAKSVDYECSKLRGLKQGTPKYLACEEEVKKYNKKTEQRALKAGEAMAIEQMRLMQRRETTGPYATTTQFYF